MKKRVLAMVLCIVMCLGMMSMFTGCKKDGGSSAAKPDAFVIMSENLDGLFNLSSRRHHRQHDPDWHAGLQLCRW